MRFARDTLARFTLDLTAEARAGRLVPIRCREPEVDRLLDILLRHGKNNPVLVGEAGVGKTAIVEGLAQRIVGGDVPHALRGVRVLALDHVALLAGTQFRGQYEERMQAIVAETVQAGDVVLFVDELHNLMGQGTAMGAAMDAANMLKPALVRGEFRVIGATTTPEYERWIRPDPALERRFQVLAVRELTSDETREVLASRLPVLERHHDVAIHDSAVAAAIRLTDLFQPERRRPDRALDALDEACAHVQARARLTPPTEALARERRAARRGPAGARARAEAPRPERPAGGADGEPPEEMPAFARDGLAALERFGAGLEALFGGGWMDAPDAAGGANGAAANVPPDAVTPDAAPPDAPGASAAAPRAEPPAADPSAGAPSAAEPRRTPAERDAELRRRLVDEGIVVRGHDVARVMSAITGKTITWID